MTELFFAFSMVLAICFPESGVINVSLALKIAKWLHHPPDEQHARSA